MRLKSLCIGNVQTENNVFLAPMAGYTDSPFRSLAIKLGAGFTFTELVSAKGLCYGGEGSKELLKSENYNLTGAQIFGADAFFLRSAIESETLKDFSVIDINMGCPVPKVFKNGEGSALLTDIKKAENIIKECVKSGKNITVKIRTGQKTGDDVASDFAIMAENAGAKLITVHGRVREAYYSGEPDYGAIYKAKKSVGIPVIANGGIFSEEDADKMIDKTGADGVMIARGAIKNPFFISKLCSKTPPDDINTLKKFMTEQIKKMLDLYGEKRTTAEFRKFLPYYIRNDKNSKELRIMLMNGQSTDEVLSIINDKFI